MNVSITKEEFEAIDFALDQVSTAIHGADDEYAKKASKIVAHLFNLMEKYKKARYWQQCRKEDDDKIRQIMKKHPEATRGMTVAQVRRLIYRGKK